MSIAVGRAGFGSWVIAPLLVEFGHHREVVDDMLRQARRSKFFAPLGSWRVAIAMRPYAINGATAP